MSKSSPKQRVIQLQSWLESRNSGGNDSKRPRKFSKADHYKKANQRYVSKEVN